MEIQSDSPAATTTDASAASSSSTTANPTTSGSCNYRYDVFISHRGPDTKKTFASYLYRRLLSHGFSAFLDQQELQEGLGFPCQIARAIETASVHVAILSPRYPESPWCLEELILMRESGAPILPVFYHLKPAKLRYGEALHELQMKRTYDPHTDKTQARYDSDTIQKWRNALSSFADVSGFDLDGKFNGDEGQMLDEVVEHVVKIMAKKTPLYVAKYPTGLDDKVKGLETVIRQQQKGKVQVVGIVGLGGVGKTTLALELFNRKRSEYAKSHFLSDVRENAKRPLHLLELQRGLLKGLTRSDQHIDNIHQGTQMLREFLSSSPVLLILDDVDHEEQVDRLIPDRNVYCSNSLILITSRDRDVLKRSGVKETSIYKLTGLTQQHSRRLFCSYAFCQAYPQQEFEDVVNKFLMACQGLPLSLKVFGALLSGKKDDKSFWEETLSRVHEVPDDIQKRLKISYDALHEREQQVFLDIVCFFIGENRDITVGIWDEPGCQGSSMFQTLECKCLVEVDRDNHIHMHDHLRDMGREIARAASPRRLWHPTENINGLLQQASGLTEVRGIRMITNEDKDQDYETSTRRQKRQELFPNRVMKLHNTLRKRCYRFHGIGVTKLQFLQAEGYLLERILTRVHSPNLIWLSWRGCPYSCLPSWIPMKNLRVLKVEGKLLKTLWQDRSQAPSQLRELEISGSLSKIPKSIEQLKHLERIFFRHVYFQKLPEEFCNMGSLKVLVLEECSKLTALPDSFGNLTNLQRILFSCHGLETLPESLGNLKNLKIMKLTKCGSLVRLPESLGNLTNLLSICLCGCPGLERLPESLGNLRNLQCMKLIECGRLERLPDSLGNLINLQRMKLIDCMGLEKLPDSLGNLTKLQIMKLIECRRLKRLPESLGNLTSLLSMQVCRCQGLEELPDSFGNLTNLQRMKLSECRRLERLPGSLGNLTNLRLMALSGSGSLERLPESLGNLTKLRHLVLSSCGSLERLPSIKTLALLKELRTSYCVKLKRIPDLAHLRKLKLLVVDGCCALEQLDGVEHCISLIRLTALGCPNLKWDEGVMQKLREQKII